MLITLDRIGDRRKGEPERPVSGGDIRNEGEGLVERVLIPMGNPGSALNRCRDRPVPVAVPEDDRTR